MNYEEIKTNELEQKPLISVIISIYNIEKYLDRCIKSVLQQTYFPLEIILVDDGSKDNSSILCDEYSEKYDNIFVVHKENQGLGFARNTGLEHIHGEYVTFIDGDDSILESHIENLYNDLQENMADTCIAGHTRVQGEHYSSHINICAGRNFKDDIICREIISRMVGKKHDRTDYIEMSVCMALYSTQIIEKNDVRFHSERELISEDLIFNMDYYPHSKSVYISEDVGYLYYDNPGSLTTKYNPQRFVKQKILTKEIVRRIEILGIYDESIQRVYNTLTSIARYSIKLEQKFSKKNGIATSLKNIKAICCDSVLQEALHKFNDTGMPKKSKIINKLMKNKKVYTLFVVMKIKNMLNV